MSCPVCYTDDADMVVCWNDHCLCETCYRECLKPRVRYDVISGQDKYHANTNCPTCREPMFDWFDLVIKNTMIPVRRRTSEEIRENMRRLIEETERFREETRRFSLSLSTPTNMGWTDLQANVLQPQIAEAVAQSGRRCGICRNTGHNRRTCNG